MKIGKRRPKLRLPQVVLQLSTQLRPPCRTPLLLRTVPHTLRLWTAATTTATDRRRRRRPTTMRTLHPRLRTMHTRLPLPTRPPRAPTCRLTRTVPAARTGVAATTTTACSNALPRSVHLLRRTPRPHPPRLTRARPALVRQSPSLLHRPRVFSATFRLQRTHQLVIPSSSCGTRICTPSRSPRRHRCATRRTTPPSHLVSRTRASSSHRSSTPLTRRSSTAVSPLIARRVCSVSSTRPALSLHRPRSRT